MARSKSFFEATPEQIRVLGLLVLLLLCIVFWPSAEWAASAVIRRNPISTDQVEAVIPRAWIAVQDGSKVQAWIPCLTIFCSPQPRSSVEIRLVRELAGKEDSWRAASEELSQTKFFSGRSAVPRALMSPYGPVQCLESTSEVTPAIFNSLCIAFQSGVVSGFRGTEPDLKEFYSMAASARDTRK